MADGTLVFVNHRPLLKWFDIAALTAMAALFAWLYLREYGVRLVDPVADIAIMATLWLFGCTACIRLYGSPSVRLTIGRRDVVAGERWIGFGRVERFAPSRLSGPAFTEHKDSDGDPHFRCTITTPSGKTIAFSEHRDRLTVEAARDRLMVAAGRAIRQPQA